MEPLVCMINIMMPLNQIAQLKAMNMHRESDSKVVHLWEDHIVLARLPPNSKSKSTVMVRA